MKSQLVSFFFGVVSAAIGVWIKSFFDRLSDIHRSLTFGVKQIDVRGLERRALLHVDINEKERRGALERLKEELRERLKSDRNSDIVVLSGPNDVGKMHLLYSAYRSVKNEIRWFSKLRVFEVNTAPEWAEVCSNVLQFARLSHCCDSKISHVVFVFDFDQALSLVAAKDIINKVRSLRRQIDARGRLVFVVKCVCNNRLPSEWGDNVWFIGALQESEASGFLKNFRSKLEQDKIREIPDIGELNPKKDINYRKCLEMSDGHIGRLISSFAKDSKRVKSMLVGAVEGSCRMRILAWQRRSGGSDNDVESFLSILYVVALVARMLRSDEDLNLRKLISVITPESLKNNEGFSFSAIKNVLRGAFCLEGVDFSQVKGGAFTYCDEALWDAYVALRGRVGVYDFVDELLSTLRLLAESPDFKGYLPRMTATAFEMSVNYGLLTSEDSPDPARGACVTMNDGFFDFWKKVPSAVRKETLVQIAHHLSPRLWQQLGAARNVDIKNACDYVCKVDSSAYSDVLAELGPLYVAIGEIPVRPSSKESEPNADSAVLCIAYSLVSAYLNADDPQNKENCANLGKTLSEELDRYKKTSPLYQIAQKVIQVAKMQYEFNVADENYGDDRRQEFLDILKALVFELDKAAEKDPRAGVLVTTLLAECSYDATFVCTKEDYDTMSNIAQEYNSRCEKKGNLAWSKAYAERAKVMLSVYTKDRKFEWGEFDSPDHLRNTLWQGIDECRREANADRSKDVSGRLAKYLEMALKTERWLNLPYRAMCMKYLARVLNLMTKADQKKFKNSFDDFFKKVKDIKDNELLPSDRLDVFSNLCDIIAMMAYLKWKGRKEFLKVAWDFLLTKAWSSMKESFKVRNRWLWAITFVFQSLTCKQKSAFRSQLIDRAADMLFDTCCSESDKDKEKWLFDQCVRSADLTRVEGFRLVQLLEELGVDSCSVIELIWKWEENKKISYTDRTAAMYTNVIMRVLNGGVEKDIQELSTLTIFEDPCPKGDEDDRIARLRLALALSPKFDDFIESGTTDVLESFGKSPLPNLWYKRVYDVLALVPSKYLPEDAGEKVKRYREEQEAECRKKEYKTYCKGQWILVASVLGVISLFAGVLLLVGVDILSKKGLVIFALQAFGVFGLIPTRKRFKANRYL